MADALRGGRDSEVPWRACSCGRPYDIARMHTGVWAQVLA